MYLYKKRNCFCCKQVALSVTMFHGLARFSQLAFGITYSLMVVLSTILQEKDSEFCINIWIYDYGMLLEAYTVLIIKKPIWAILNILAPSRLKKMFIKDRRPHLKFFAVIFDGKLILQKTFYEYFLTSHKYDILWNIQVSWWVLSLFMCLQFVWKFMRPYKRAKRMTENENISKNTRSTRRHH